MTNELFNRDLSMKVGGATIEMQTTDPVAGVLQSKINPILKVSFTIERTSDRDPNRATVDIYNLNEANRRTLQEGSKLAEASDAYDWPLEINAGYVGSKSLLFSGDIDYANSVRNRSTWVTSIEAGDGSKKFRSARLNKSFGPGTPLLAVLSSAADAMGIGLGNSVAHFSAPLRRISVFRKGVTLNGRVSKILDKYVTSAGFQWSIQDRQLQVLSLTETTLETVVILDKHSGLVGSPEISEDGIVTGTSLLQGDIKPGRRLVLNSDMIQGTFKTTRVVHSGDTWGKPWYSKFEGEPLA